MVEMDDVETLLQTGSWKPSSSRSKSPNPYGRGFERDYDRNYDRDYSYNRPPPNSHPYGLDARSSRSMAGLARRPRHPPPPSVEDETESLAREHTPSIAPSSSDEEPKNRGEIDQHPILVPVVEDDTTVLEDNPERRFVLVTGAGTDTWDAEQKPRGDHQRSPARPRRDDRNGNLYNERPEDDDIKASTRRPELVKRKSRQDLPPLETSFYREDAPIRRSNSRRNREKPVVDQEPSRSARPIDDNFLSPVVRTAGGRERAYLDFNAGSSRAPGGARGPRDPPKSSRTDGRRSTHSSTSSALPRRLSSSASGARPYVDAQPSTQHGYGSAEDAMAFMRSGGDVSARDRSSVSPTKTRKSNSPPYPGSSKDRPSDRPAGQRNRRESNAREQPEYYGSESFKSGRSSRTDRPAPRRAGEPESLLSPEGARPIPIGRTGPRGPSPLPSPRVAQGGQFVESSSLPNARSSTFPAPPDRRKPDDYFSPVSGTTNASPPRKVEDGDRTPRPRAPSRSSSSANAGLAASLPTPGSLGRGERRNPATVHEDDDPGSPVTYWQPGPFDPETQGVHLDNLVVSFRRYSEDVQQGVLPQLPECRWIVPAVPRNGAGGTLFLTLPRANNFTICPDCFSGAFANRPEFVQKFIPAPARSPDQPVSCDFGSSPWYRIAYLMTLKYRYPDLRLLENVAAVAARHQDCPGAQPASRMWYSMTDPRSRRAIASFIVCSSCAHMVGALLPNLAGIFSPLDPHASPTRGICDLHFAPDRKRFLDYFDVLEISSDRARNRSVPDIQAIANQIRDISLVEECYRNTPLQNAKWHVMAGLPEFTVCEECYDIVIWPLIEDDKKTSDVTRNFIRGRQVIPVASCQLYSDRMRKLFNEACRKNDLDYLVSEVKQKATAEAEIKTQYSRLLQQDQKDPGIQRELLELRRRLKELE